MDALKREQVLNTLDHLPAEKLAEVIDFIEFIVSRPSAAPVPDRPAEGGQLPDIGDLVGKLDWRGDPVTWQRAMRDEWQ
ncbi:MAG: hypothetical protein PHU46_00695 [Rhodocyclaceae bacterium]|nr:hypothetical protein [Rhodocyclaceae bacterium]